MAKPVMMMDINTQSVDAKKAEITRPFVGEDILKNKRLGMMYWQRGVQTIVELEHLEEKDINFDPFLEIGAGGAQRSIALVNQYSTEGAAIDISFNSLRNGPFILSLFKYDKIPLLICCDAHQLPFFENSFNFVFAYRTFHHFNNPIPVFRECYRVLGKGGYLFFNEEPMSSPLRKILRGNRTLSNPPTKYQEIGYKLGVQKVFWDDGKLEREAGITEARFDIDVWKQTLEKLQNYGY